MDRIGGTLPAGENQRSAWLAEHVGTKQGKFGSQSTRQWRRDYESFSEALIKKASSSGFDSTCLSAILKLVLADTNGQPLAYVPVAAYETTLNSEAVWIVVVHWEECFGSENPVRVRQLSHVREYAFTQKDRKQVGFATCR